MIVHVGRMERKYLCQYKLCADLTLFQSIKRNHCRFFFFNRKKVLCVDDSISALNFSRKISLMNHQSNQADMEASS